MDSTFTHLAVMRGALACGWRPRQVIQDHVTGEPCSPRDVSPPGRPRQTPYPSHLCALAVAQSQDKPTGKVKGNGKPQRDEHGAEHEQTDAKCPRPVFDRSRPLQLPALTENQGL